MKDSLRTNALVAGSALVIMAIAAGFSYGFVYGKLIVDGDPMATVNNLRDSGFLFRVGIAGWILIFLTDIAVALSLYNFLKPVNRRFSLVSAAARLLYTMVLGVAIIRLASILPLVNDPAVLDPSRQVAERLDAFLNTWSLGLIIFGLHLVGLGFLTFRSVYVPRIFGLLLYFAGACYFLVNSGKQFLTAYEALFETLEKGLSIPMAIGEIAFAIWLIIAGGVLKKDPSS